MNDEKVNVLLVDDQPGKLLTYEAVLKDLGENLLTARNAREALEILLKNDVAVILVDVYMPDTDGFQLAAMIREHPRYRKIAVIFISAILLTDVDRLRGYEMGAVDYVPVPVIPEVLRAKVKIFIELYRKTRQLELLNSELERRVIARTTELAASTAQLRQSEQLRSLALAAGQMGSWEWDALRGVGLWDHGQCAIFGVDSSTFVPTQKTIKPLLHPDDRLQLLRAFRKTSKDSKTFQNEFRVRRPDGSVRWCVGVAAASFDQENRLTKISGVTIDITDRKLAEERQTMLAEEVDHRARNVVAVVQSIMRLTQESDIESYIEVVNGRINALSNAHKLLASSRWQGADLQTLIKEEMAPYEVAGAGIISINGPPISLPPAMAQTIALAIHELVTNAAKYGALSQATGAVKLKWWTKTGTLELEWTETGGPETKPPTRRGYGIRVITAGIEQQLGGEVAFDWRSNGLLCNVKIPLQNGNSQKLTAAAEEQSKEAVSSHALDIGSTQKPILIVEDEPMVSMLLAELVDEFGHAVDGPYNKYEDALRAASHNNLQAGILDVNMGGQNTYALADLLMRRQIPFIFVTGYGANSIDRRFTHVPILQKPFDPKKLHDLLLKTKLQ